MTEIAGSNILITGGASGLGRSMALQMAERGAHLILWDLHEANLEKVVDEIKTAGGRAHAYVCDVSNRRTVYKVAGQVKEDVGKVDVLVNSAGVVSGERFLDLSDKQIEKTFAVNTLALYWTAKAFLPDMVSRNKGHVVTISSAGGMLGIAKMADYSASKAAAINFDESLRMELADTSPGVKTTIVCPFYIDTGMFEGVKTRFPQIFPILKEGIVAHRIVQAIENDSPRFLIPPALYLMPILRLLPIPLFDRLSNFCGINVSMEDFKGRQKVRLVASRQT